MSAAGPSQGANGAPSGGVGVVMSAAGPSQGANGAPSGGVGVVMSAAGPSQGANGALSGGVGAVPIDARRLARLRWRCRRGMLENDLVLTRFLDARGDAISEEEVAMLDLLLDLPDQALWDLVVGREAPDPRVAPLVAMLSQPVFPQRNLERDAR